MQKNQINILRLKNEKKYEIDLRDKAKKSLEKIPLIWRTRISKAIDALEDNPYAGEKLSGEFSGCFKIKIWPYRIIFKIFEDRKEVYIYKIEHRQSVYKK